MLYSWNLNLLVVMRNNLHVSSGGGRDISTVTPFWANCFPSSEFKYKLNEINHCIPLANSIWKKSLLFCCYLVYKKTNLTQLPWAQSERVSEMWSTETWWERSSETSWESVIMDPFLVLWHYLWTLLQSSMLICRASKFPFCWLPSLLCSQMTT